MIAGDWVRLILLSVVWGASFFFIGVAVDDVTPLTIVMVRLTVAAAALWLVLIIMRIPVPKTFSAWGSLLLMGVLNNIIPFSFIVWAQTNISSSLASIMNATVPIFTTLVAGFFLADERLTIQKISGIVIGFFGVVVLIGPSSLLQADDTVLAQIAILCATLSYSFANTYGRRFKSLGFDVRVVATGQVTTAAIIIIPLACIFEQPLQTLVDTSLGSWVAMIALAMVSTAFGYLLYFSILSRAGATNISLVAFLVPVSSIFLGIVFLQETLVGKDIAGMACIGLGLAVLDGRLWQGIKKSVS